MNKRRYLMAAIIVAFLIAGVFVPRSFDSSAKVVFQVEKGQTLREISVNLKKHGLIWWDSLFKTYALLRGETGKLQAGCYLLSPAINIPQITEILSSGAIAKEKVTIPEGFTSEQIYDRLKGITEVDLSRLKEKEGYLFPDTYEIPYCQEQDKVIAAMIDNFDRKTASLTITPKIVVMASLLERELKTKEDKALASGILWKRLRVGMPLQVDAEMWTYDNYGLPESPISNPGLESLEAALQPKESPYWYYLSAKDGRTIFSRTLEEHNIAKAKYLR